MGEASGDITVKILPSASDVKKRAEEVAEDQKQKGEATVPDPGLGGADPNKKDDKEDKKNGGGDDAAEGGGEEKTGATKAAVAKTAVAVEEAAATIKAKTGNRRRRLGRTQFSGIAA